MPSLNRVSEVIAAAIVKWRRGTGIFIWTDLSADLAMTVHFTAVHGRTRRVWDTGPALAIGIGRHCCIAVGVGAGGATRTETANTLVYTNSVLQLIQAVSIA